MHSKSKVADDSQIREAIMLWAKDCDLNIYELEIPDMYKYVEPDTMLYAMDCFSIEEYEALEAKGSYIMKDCQSTFCWLTRPEELKGLLKHFSVVGSALIKKNINELEVVLNVEEFISHNKNYAEDLSLMRSMIFVRSTEAARTISFDQVSLRPY